MIARALSHTRQAFLLLVLMVLVLGGVVPLVFTALSQLLFPTASNGSLIVQGDKIIGSELIGQEFSSSKYFWGRLSATTPPYNPSASAASNLSMGNTALLERANVRMKELPAPTAEKKIPLSLVTSSASGLDPHIPLAAAYYQTERVAKARGMKAEAVNALIEQIAEQPALGFIGAAQVNVLRLNLALDGHDEK